MAKKATTSSASSSKTGSVRVSPAAPASRAAPAPVAPKAASSTKNAAAADAVRVQPRPVVNPGSTGLTVENQEAADREVSERQRLASEASRREGDDQRLEMQKAPGKPFIPARDALNKLSEEVIKIRDEDRTYWSAAEMRRLRDEAAGVLRSIEDMVTGDAN